MFAIDFAVKNTIIFFQPSINLSFASQADANGWGGIKS